MRQLNTYYHALPVETMGKSVNEQENYSWGILHLVNKQIEIDKKKYTLRKKKKKK